MNGTLLYFSSKYFCNFDFCLKFKVYPIHLFVFFSSYRDTWITIINESQQDLLPIKTILKNKVWFEYLEAQNHRDSHYRCRLCLKYYDDMNFPINSKPTLATKHGQLLDTKKKNFDAINSHNKHVSHNSIIENLKRNAAKRQRTDFFNIQRSEESRNESKFEITARMIRTVYVINKLTLPFSDHKSIVLLQKLNGLDMGYPIMNVQVAQI